MTSPAAPTTFGNGPLWGRMVFFCYFMLYSPPWDAQLGLWTEMAVRPGLNKRQIDEVQVSNLAANRRSASSARVYQSAVDGATAGSTTSGVSRAGERQVWSRARAQSYQDDGRLGARRTAPASCASWEW